MVYPGAKHGLIRQHDGRHAYATMLRFFDANSERAPRPVNSLGRTAHDHVADARLEHQLANRATPAQPRIQRAA